MGENPSPYALSSYILVLGSCHLDFPVTIFIVLFILVLTGLLRYLPQHLIVMQRRAVYYLWGQEGDERLLWQWLGVGVSAGSGGSGPGVHKEL